MRDKTRYRVVLSTGVPYGAAATGDTFTRDAAFTLAAEYFAHAQDGDQVRIYIPPDSRDSADYRWTKGIDAGPDGPMPNEDELEAAMLQAARVARKEDAAVEVPQPWHGPGPQGDK
jgi:hypothetical protein